MKVVIPIAGRGSRFQEAVDQNPEYKKPKPLIEINGKPMVIWALESLPFIAFPNKIPKTEFNVPMKDLIFITLKDHQERYDIREKLQEIFSPEITVIVIPDVTRGAVETVLQAKKYINTDEEIIVSDCDHYFNGTELYKSIVRKDNKTGGIIPVFRPPDKDPKWSYTLFTDGGTALAVGEKDPILAEKGAYANIGAYYFSKGRIFVDEAEKMIAENDTYGVPGKEEFYVAPLYQRLIAKGMIIKAAIIPKVWGLGTPKDVETFIQTL